MSAHNGRSKGRHPDAPREQFEVAHITFELSAKNKTFALIAGEAVTAKDRKPLFTGIVPKDMWKQLTKLAARIKEIQP